MTLKKAIAKALLAFAISLTTLALFCINASAAAKTTVVLVDETYSSRYFSYEPTVSEYLNNTSADIVRFGKNGKTALYDEVQKAIDDGYVNIYIISDCWNTTGRDRVEANNTQITLLTPYFESKDVDKHLSDVVEKLTTTSTVNVEYWGKWPKVKSVPTLEPETDPDEDLMYRTTEVDEDMLENLETLSDEKDVAKTANTLNNAILEDMEIPRESYILGDCSGSMAAFQEDVLQKVQVSEGKKYVFAEKSEEFSENRSISAYDIGCITDIVEAINVALKEAPKDAHIYLLSDLGDNCESIFDEDACSSFEGIVTIVYYPSGYEYSDRMFIERMQAQMPKATFEIC